MPVGKQYEVVIPFHRVDPKTGDVTEYAVGDSYSGEDVDKYLADPNEFAPDHGPLIREKTAQASADKSVDVGKEK